MAQRSGAPFVPGGSRARRSSNILTDFSPHNPLIRLPDRTCLSGDRHRSIEDRIPRRSLLRCPNRLNNHVSQDSLVSLPHQVPEVLFILVTDVLNKLSVGRECKLKIHAPRFGVGLGVVDSDLKVDMPKIAAAESFRQMHGFRSGMTAVVQPVVINKARG